MSWRLAYSSRSLRDLKKLDAKIRKRIMRSLDRHAESGEGDLKKLTDVDPPQWRLRVGPWRVRVTRDAARKTIFVLRVSRRDRAY